ncbi:DUF3060 domain-containing protein [Mycolicibacterium sp.]|uniref:DUF3060 domain-containing protein n=1 Tax=Mycolicibacterium sp. TaxID=2320850 RepID=UPI001A21C7FA|nr:DUF3060 domain-containing protein [Mycolicibacterium sp.]MBJ7336843.1 DUF3060 domain-containing protein [Mycolicibacterium sp.]
MKGTTVVWKALGTSLAVAVIAASGALSVGVPTAQAKNGDTHITGQGINQTLDCNDSALIVVGSNNNINAVGSCWGVSVQGSSNIIVVDNVVNDITVYGFDQTVLYHSGDPAVLDRGRELGMTNRIDRVAA